MIPPSAWLVDMVVQTSLVIVVALGASWLLRRTAPAVRSALWLVVLVRLCAPVPLTLPTGLMPESGSARPAVEARSAEAVDVAEPGPVPEAPAALEAPPPVDKRAAPAPAPFVAAKPASTKPLVSEADAQPRQAQPLPWLSVAWLAGVVLLALLAVAQTVVVQRRVRRCRPIEDPRVLALAEELRRLAGVRRRVPIVVAGADSRIPAPAVLGVLRPVIVLPESVAAWSHQQLGPMLLHELTHVGRGDLLINAVQRWVQVVHFYNPLVWLANRQLRRERELATDDAVVRLLGGRPKPYLEALVAVAEQSVTWRPAPLAVGLAEPTSQLERRIRRMQHSSFLSTLARTPRLAIAASLALGLVLSVLAAQKPVAATLKGTVACEGQSKAIQATAWSWSDRLFEHPDELMEPLATTKVAPGQAFELELPTDDLPVLVELSAPEHVALRYLVVFEEDRQLQPAYLRLGATRQVTVRDGTKPAGDVLVRGQILVTGWSRDPHRWRPCVPSTLTDEKGRAEIVVPPVGHEIQLEAIDGEGRWARSDEEREVTTLRLADRTTEVTVVDSRQRPIAGVRVAPDDAPVGAGSVTDKNGMAQLWMTGEGRWSIVAVGTNVHGRRRGHGAPASTVQVEARPLEGTEIATGSASPVAATTGELPAALLLVPMTGVGSVHLPIQARSGWLWSPRGRVQWWRGGGVALPKTARVEGRVVRRDGGPVAELPVWVLGPQLTETFGDRRTLLDATGAPALSRPWLPWGFTDASGHFAVDGLSPMRALVEVHAPGLPPARSERFNLGNGGRAEISVRLVPGADIRVTVTDPDGIPIEGARVAFFQGPVDQAYDFRGNRLDSYGEPIDQALTDREGAAKLASVPLGPAHLSVSKAGFVPLELVSVQVEAGDTELGPVVLTPSVAIRGTTVGPEGDAVGNAEVIVLSDPQMPPEYARHQVATKSDEHGQFSITELEPGAELAIAAQAQGLVPTDPVKLVLPVAKPVRVAMEPERVLEGTVEDAESRALEEAHVVVTTAQRANASTLSAEAYASATRRATTDDRGRFRVDGLRGGLHHLAVSKDGYVVHRQQLELGAPEEVEPVTVVLEEAAEIEVQVLRSDGQPVSGVEVTWHGEHSSSGRGVTDTGGVVVLSQVAEGPFTVRARAPNGAAGTAKGEAKGFTSVVVRLQDPGALKGQVVRSDGQPVSEARLWLVGATSGAKTTTSDASGRFRYSDLEPGEAHIVAKADGLGVARKVVHIESGETTTISLELGDAGIVTGEVRGLTSAELRQCRVRVGRSILEEVDHDGRYTLNGVPEGQQIVLASLQNNPNRTRAKSVTVTAGDTAHVILDFGDEHTVSGHLLREGAPAPDLPVRIATLDGHPVDGARSSASGDYRLTVSRTGTYRLTATNTAGRTVASRVVEVDGPTTADLEISSGTISGLVVRARTLEPVAEAPVEVIGESLDVSRWVTTDTNGGFEITDVPDGQFLVTAKLEGEMDSEPVTVRDGQAQHLVLQIENAPELVVHVSRASGATVTRITVLARAVSGGPPLILNTQCEQPGTCPVTSLAEGSYLLNVESGDEAGAVTAVVPGEISVRLSRPGRLLVRAAPTTSSGGEVWRARVLDAASGVPSPWTVLWIGASAGGWTLVGETGLEHFLPAGSYVVEARSESGRAESHTVDLPSEGAVTLTIGDHSAP